MSLVTDSSQLDHQDGVEADDPPPCAAMRVPPEILLSIFQLLQYGRPSHPLRWIPVTHVCQLWRNVALHQPSLWAVLSDMDVPSPISNRWIDVFIQRSHPLPLTLHYNHTIYSPTTKHLAAVARQMTHRLGTLYLLCCNKDFLAQLDKPALLLSQLEIYQPDPHSLGKGVPRTLFGDVAPLLRAAKFVNVPVPLSAKWLSQLRRLELGGQWRLYDGDSGARIPLSINSCLYFLSTLPHIEELFIRLPDNWAPDSRFEITTPVHFPNLTSLDIRMHALGSADILECITVERPIWLTIGANISALDFSLIEPICKFFANNARPSTSIAWDEQSIWFATDHVYVDRHGLILSCNSGGMEELSRYVLPILQPSCDIRVLHLYDPDSPWLDLSNLDTVQSLYIFHRDILHQLLHNTRTPCLFPSLRWVHLRRLDLTGVMDDLKEWVMQRGPTSKLERLSFRGCEGVTSHYILLLSDHVEVRLED